MKLKVFIVIAVILMAGTAAVTLLLRPRTPHVKFPTPQQQWQETITNYSRAFTLNTNPPLWPETKGATNGNH